MSRLNPRRIVHIGFTDDELDYLRYCARDAGVSLSAYIRRLSLKGATK